MSVKIDPLLLANDRTNDILAPVVDYFVMFCLPHGRANKYATPEAVGKAFSSQFIAYDTSTILKKGETYRVGPSARATGGDVGALGDALTDIEMNALMQTASVADFDVKPSINCLVSTLSSDGDTTTRSTSTRAVTVTTGNWGYMGFGAQITAPDLMESYSYIDGAYFSKLLDMYRPFYNVLRPGLKNISPEWLNRLCRDAMSSVMKRAFDIEAPYFLFTWPLVTNTYSVVEQSESWRNWADIKYSATPVFSGNSFSEYDINTLDPWKKMFRGVEHMVYLYGEGEGPAVGADGLYAWPMGERLSIAPTVGNIYVRYLQAYLKEIANRIGSGMSTPVMNSVDSNVSFATVFPESATSAAVHFGPYVITSGPGITYAHPEGRYIGRLMSEAGASDTEIAAHARDIAAYANRERQKWIAGNQAVYKKAREIAEAGGPIYTTAIDQVVAATVVTVDPTGNVTSTTGTATVTSGTNQGSIVTTAPTSGQAYNLTNVTPASVNPIGISTVWAKGTYAATDKAVGSPVVTPAVKAGQSSIAARFGLQTTKKAASAVVEKMETDAGNEIAAPVQKPASGAIVPVGFILGLLTLFS